MKATEFVVAYAGKSLKEREQAIYDLAARGEIVPWALAPVTLRSPDGKRSATVRVTTDYLAIGDPSSGDILRVPMTPGGAQRVLDLWGMSLPTTRIARATFAQSPNRVSLHEQWPNREGDLKQHLEHSRLVDEEIRKRGLPEALTSGQNKDIVVGNAMKPGAAGAGGLLIYGAPVASAMVPSEDPLLMAGGFYDPKAPASTKWRIQPYSPVHGAQYLDYSHGIRAVHPLVTLDDGSQISLDVALRDPALAPIFSDEGVLKHSRYPYPGSETASSAPAGAGYPGQSLADRGLDTVRDRKLTALEEAARRAGLSASGPGLEKIPA